MILSKKNQTHLKLFTKHQQNSVKQKVLLKDIKGNFKNREICYAHGLEACGLKEQIRSTSATCL